MTKSGDYTQNPWTSPVQDGGAKLNHDAAQKVFLSRRSKLKKRAVQNQRVSEPPAATLSRS
jgi:hypothetical protein